MNQLFKVFAIVSIFLITDASAAPTERPAQLETEIVRAEFGLFNPPESGKPAFVPATIVPLEQNQLYGWIIRVKTNKEFVKWREVFTLPASPETWGDGERQGLHSISSDRRTSVTEREVKPDKDIIYNVWTVAPGDPKGHYVIRVIIDGTAERTFEFDVK
jgi:hypothetical protein